MTLIPIFTRKHGVAVMYSSKNVTSFCSNCFYYATRLRALHKMLTQIVRPTSCYINKCVTAVQWFSHSCYEVPPHRDHSGCGLGQWEQALLYKTSNAFSHWPSPYPEWSLPHSPFMPIHVVRWAAVSPHLVAVFICRRGSPVPKMATSQRLDGISGARARDHFLGTVSPK